MDIIYIETFFLRDYLIDEFCAPFLKSGDELERYGFFKKSKARVTKRDDQSEEHHHEGANLDESCDQRDHV